MESCSSNLPQKQRPLTLDEALEYEMKNGRLSNVPNIDLKKIRRNLSNKLSAQRSRIKMVNNTRELEKKVKDLEALIPILTPQVESCTEKKRLLQLENESLCKELERRSNESRRLEMEIEEIIAGIKMLKEPVETAQMNNHAANSEPKHIQADFGLQQLNVPNYPNLNFYQACLQNQHKPSSSAVLPNMAPDSSIERSGKEIKPADEEENASQQEFEDVDQYINFDAVNAADPSHVEIS